MWWTQGRLTFVGCSLHSAAIVLTGWRISDTMSRIATLAVVDVFIVAVLFLASRRLARRHRHGELRRAFERSVWRGIWRKKDRFNDDLVRALDREQPGRQTDVQGDRPYFASLYDATSELEGARLDSMWNSGGMLLIAAVTWLVLAVGLPIAAPRDGVVAACLGFLLASWTTIAVDFDAYRELLRSGTVERVAALVARRFDDLDIPDLTWSMRIITIVALGNLVSAGIVAARRPDLAALAAANSAVLLVSLALARVVLVRLPLLRFPGPAAVSAFVDFCTRLKRVEYLTAAMWAWVFGFLLDADRGLVSWILFPVAIVLAAALMLWNPLWFRGDRDPEQLARRLRGLQRRSCLADSESKA